MKIILTVDQNFIYLKKNYKLKLEHKDLKNGPQEFWIYKINVISMTGFPFYFYYNSFQYNLNLNK